MAYELDPKLWGVGNTADLTLDHIKVLSYGASGVGKNFFSESWPGRVYLDLEDGLIGCKVRKRNAPYLKPKSWAAIQQFASIPAEVLEAAHPGYKVETVVLDSVTFLGSSNGILMNQIMSEKSAGKAAYPTITEFGRVTDKLRGLFMMLKALPYNVLVICQEHTEKNDLIGDIATKPSMIGQMRGEAAAYVDIALWHTIENGDDGKEYVAYPTRVTSNIGKDRLGVLEDRIVNPTYDYIMQRVQQALKEA